MGETLHDTCVFMLRGDTGVMKGLASGRASPIQGIVVARPAIHLAPDGGEGPLATVSTEGKACTAVAADGAPRYG